MSKNWRPDDYTLIGFGIAAAGIFVALAWTILYFMGEF